MRVLLVAALLLTNSCSVAASAPAATTAGCAVPQAIRFELWPGRPILLLGAGALHGAPPPGAPFTQEQSDAARRIFREAASETNGRCELRYLRGSVAPAGTFRELFAKLPVAFVGRVVCTEARWHPEFDGPKQSAVNTIVQLAVVDVIKDSSGKLQRGEIAHAQIFGGSMTIDGATVCTPIYAGHPEYMPKPGDLVFVLSSASPVYRFVAPIRHGNVDTRAFLITDPGEVPLASIR